jgi:ABC-2 type transport system ATP-binding protein
MPSRSQLGERCGTEFAVEISNLIKSFPMTHSVATWIRHGGTVPRRRVLHNISLQVRTGELFGLLGPNGAGKTTLLKLLATLCIPDSGRVIMAGVDAVKYPLIVKQRIGLCTSEERSFYFRLSARSNLRFFGTLMGLAGRRLEERIKEVSTLVDLSWALDRRFDSFSSGMRQRLALARALLADPPILLLDEPTRAVDPLHAREIRSLIRHELVDKQGRTAILATNLLEEAWAICDRVAIVDTGRIIAQGAPQELDATLARTGRYRATFLQPPTSIAEDIQNIPGVRTVSIRCVGQTYVMDVEYDSVATALRDLVGRLIGGPAQILSLRSEDPEPLEVFLRLIEHDRNA